MDDAVRNRLQLRHARELRTDQTKAEGLLWSRLRGQQLGQKFRRQHLIGPFIADFACVTAKLIVEIDGKSHLGRVAEDLDRTAFLGREGWRVVRYQNLDVIDRLKDVVRDIARQLASETPT